MSKKQNPIFDKNARYGPQVVADLEKREGGYQIPFSIRADVQYDNLETDPDKKAKFKKLDELCIRIKFGSDKLVFKTPLSLVGWKVFVDAVNLANEKFVISPPKAE